MAPGGAAAAGAGAPWGITGGVGVGAGGPAAGAPGENDSALISGKRVDTDDRRSFIAFDFSRFSRVFFASSSPAKRNFVISGIPTPKPKSG